MERAASISTWKPSSPMATAQIEKLSQRRPQIYLNGSNEQTQEEPRAAPRAVLGPLPEAPVNTLTPSKALVDTLAPPGRSGGCPPPSGNHFTTARAIPRQPARFQDSPRDSTTGRAIPRQPARFHDSPRDSKTAHAIPRQHARLTDMPPGSFIFAQKWGGAPHSHPGRREVNLMTVAQSFGPLVHQKLPHSMKIFLRRRPCPRTSQNSPL